MAILVSFKVDFKTKNIIRNQVRYFIIIKVSIRNIITINTYASNDKASKYTKNIYRNIWRNRQFHNITGDFDISPSTSDRPLSKKS